MKCQEQEFLIVELYFQWYSVLKSTMFTQSNTKFITKDY